MKTVRLDERMIGEECPALIIAEIASSHEGSLSDMKDLVRAAKDAEADAVKFQIYKAENLVTKNHPKYESFTELEYTEDEWKSIIKLAKELGLLVLVDVFDDWGLKISKDLADGFKVTSATISEPGLVSDVAKTGKPVFIGIGGSTEKEIEKTMSLIRSGRGNKKDDSIILLHGFQAFPTKIEDMNLSAIRTIKKRFGLPVGFADHVDGEMTMARIMPLVSMGFGACAIEKHITLDRSKKGRDHYSSLNPKEFKEMVEFIRVAERSYGNGEIRLSKNEREYREKMKKYIVAARNIRKGELFKNDMLLFRRTPEPGFLPSEIKKVLGRKAKKDINLGEPVKAGDITTVGVLIAVRMKSKRLPRKAMIKICGKPLIEHVIESFKDSQMSNSIILCTSDHNDDRVLVEQAKRAGVKWFTGSEDDVLQRFIDAAETNNVDVIVRGSGEDPLTDIETMDSMIKSHLECGVDYTYTKQLPRGTSIEVISIGALKRARVLADNPEKSEYMTLYFRDSGMFDVNEYKVSENIRRPEYRLSVDTPKDLELMESIFNRLYRNKRIRLVDVIALMEKNPELIKINKKIQQRKCGCEIVNRLGKEKIRIVVEE